MVEACLTPRILALIPPLPDELLLFRHSVMSVFVIQWKSCRFPCPPPSPRVCSNSCPLSQRCHPTTSSCLQSFPASGFLSMGWLFESIVKESESVICAFMSDSLQPQGLKPTRLLCPWHSPGKSTGVGSRSLLQGIFPTLGLNPGLLNYRQIFFFLPYAPPGKPHISRDIINLPFLV